MSRPRDLPEFHRPPVSEVALSAQFDELSGFRITDFGCLWDASFKASYPTVSTQPPLSPEFETFGDGPRATRQIPQIQLRAGPLIPRVWFSNLDGTSLLQLQPDRFVHNWRKIGEAEIYPRYERVKSIFIQELTQVADYAQKILAAPPSYNQCEVTYVNTISIDDYPNGIGSIFNIWKAPPSSFLPEQEAVRWATRYIIHTHKAQPPVGRLLVEAVSGLSRSGTPMVQLTLTARGRPREPSIEAIAEFLDLGREWVVRTFAEITTEEMHMRWQRVQEA